jgi:hypothetical protein
MHALAAASKRVSFVAVADTVFSIGPWSTETEGSFRLRLLPFGLERGAPHVRNPESRGNGRSSHALRLHFPHARRVYRSWPTLVHAFGLGLTAF